MGVRQLCLRRIGVRGQKSLKTAVLNVTCISTVLLLLPTCTQTHGLSDRQIPPQQPKQQYIYARSRPRLPACRALPAPRQPRHPVPGQGLGHPAFASLLLFSVTGCNSRHFAVEVRRSTHVIANVWSFSVINRVCRCLFRCTRKNYPRDPSY